MKKLLFFLLVLAGIQYVSAQKYICKNGLVSLNASTPLESIDCKNNQAASILDAATGEIVFNVLIKSFEFKNALMQEHFNENYMESDKFPKATFKGKISNLASVNLAKDGTYPVDITGDITIHGVTKPLPAKGNLVVKGGVISANSKFTVHTADYNIIIPKLVEGKIAKDVEVVVDLAYNKM
jgi:polyisoprenoid-binding protein YceI